MPPEQLAKLVLKRRLALDPEGKSDSNNLLYSQLQSQPLYLVAGVGAATVDLNLLAPKQLTLEVKDLPSEIKVGASQVKALVWMAVHSDGIQYYEHGPLSPSDTPPRDGWPLPLPTAPNQVAGALVSPDELPHTWWLPPRKYEIILRLQLLQPLVVSGFSNQIGVSKPTKLDIDLANQGSATITVNLIGEPLEKQLAWHPNDPDAQAALPTWLQQVAPKIELNAKLEQ